MKSRASRHQAYLRIIDRLWKHNGRVTYTDFLRALEHSRAHMSPELLALAHPISQSSFSQFFRQYCRENNIQRQTYSWIQQRIMVAFRDGEIDASHREKNLITATQLLLTNLKVIVPSTRVLRRLIRSARAEVAGRRRETRLEALEQSLGIVLKDVPLVQRFEAAQELLRYPPSWQGKANLKTMAREAQIQMELDEIIRTNDLPRETILAHPQLVTHHNLIERLRPSYLLNRREKRAIAEALPFYVVGRWRDARDTVLTCFVRKARLLRFNLNNLYEETVRDASLSFLEKSTPRFNLLHRAVLESLETGSVANLRGQRKFLTELNREGIRFASREDYYLLLSGRGGYVRKMAHRLASIPFVGQDTRAHAIVTAMDEVCRFKPFRVPISGTVVDRLRFLNVPPSQLRRRKIFEPVILMTLADLLWSGRVTVPGSIHFRNRWHDLPSQSDAPSGPHPAHWVRNLRQRLEVAGALFRYRTKECSVIRDGRLAIPRGRREKSIGQAYEDGEMISPAALRLPAVGIVDLLWEVHQGTGFLDAFQLEGHATRHLPDEERRRLTIAALLGLGLNLGLQEISHSLGRGYKYERLRAFAANYVTVRTLREALAHIIDAWDRLGLGRSWGPGTTCSVDGRVVFSYARNLLSQYHYRKGRVGVTIYWVVRDDHLASSVRIIGNQEWESWFILDDLMNPIGGKPLEVSSGDTHGQHLAAWGLADLLGKRITVRFRQLGQVKIYGPKPGKWCGLTRVSEVNWALLRKASNSLHRVAAAIKSGAIAPSEILRIWNLYDESGVNIAEALRELGKVVRTEFILTYASDPHLREEIQQGCQRAENWNSFQEAVFFGKGGRIETNNPHRRDEIGLAMALILDSILFYNAWKWGARLKKGTSLTPAIWSHVKLLGRYRFRREPAS